MTTMKDRVAGVRATFKVRGWTARRVGIRVTPGGSVRVTIKDPALPFHEVDRIARAVEHIDRCSYSGEILCGGNTFVWVGHSDQAREALADRYRVAITSAIDTLDREDRGQSRGSCVRVAEDCYISSDGPDCYHGLGRMFLRFGRNGLTEAAYRLALLDPDQAAQRGEVAA